MKGLLTGKDIEELSEVADLIIEINDEPTGLMAEPASEDYEIENMILQTICVTVDKSSLPDERKREIYNNVIDFAIEDRVNGRHLDNMIIFLREVVRETE